MLEVDPDKNLTEIRDLIRKHEDDVPELKEVKLSANKDELVDQLNQALEDYLGRITSLDAKPEVYDEIVGADVLDVDTDEVAQSQSSGQEDPSVQTDLDDGEPSAGVQEETAGEESGAEPYSRDDHIKTLP
jgi:hypothetical protein